MVVSAEPEPRSAPVLFLAFWLRPAERADGVVAGGSHVVLCGVVASVVLRNVEMSSLHRLLGRA